MNIAQVEENVKTLLLSECNQDAFIYELLLAYGHRKQSVTRLRSGERNMASKNNEPHNDEIIWKRHLYYKHVEGSELHAEIDQMRKEKLVATNKVRFVIVTNFDQLLAVDTKTSDSLDINLDELPKQFDFFLPWAGMEKAVYQGENPADVKAAEKMAKLFDLIKRDNFDESNRDDTEALHSLNVFLTRLLFCFFAEDTEIFTDNQFSLAIKSHTKDDGSDLSDYLNRLFTVLNTSDGARGELPDYLTNFPYVNGGLFADDIPSPEFSAKSRRMLIECGSELDWSDINPDIFGSMIQAVAHPDQRGGMGMHYTSATNIMKVIEPLFLNDLYEELDKVSNSTTQLQKLQQRLGEIKIFDPACGSGNFLIIAYKELRKLEMELLKCWQELELQKTGQVTQAFSIIKLSEFYGIELDDFAHEVAILSLWLAEHQMNVEFKVEFGECAPSLPLERGGGIVSGNAARIPWQCVCENSKKDEVYILGNPPYLGFSLQSKEQKEDLFEVVGSKTKLDYISCWFIKASNYIRGTSACFSFVSTNSICQGEQVPLLWPDIFSKDQEIYYCHRSFKWENNARGNAAVICVIVGVSAISNRPKYIFSEGYSKEVAGINAYLVEGKNTVPLKRKVPLSPVFPLMVLGNMAKDGGGLFLDRQELDEAIASFPEIEEYIKKCCGSVEFINGIEQWCIWVGEAQYRQAKDIPFLQSRFDSVCDMRLSSPKASTKEYAKKPYRFVEVRHQETQSIIIPRVSSERRKYIPIGYLSSDVIVKDSAYAIYNAEPFVFALLSSSMHMAWVRAVAGRLKSDIRYSSLICYNNFPVPELSEKVLAELSSKTIGILSVREGYPDMTLGDLYDPDKMPLELRQCHDELDIYIDSLYSRKKNLSEAERLSVLFDLYSSMTRDEDA